MLSQIYNSYRTNRPVHLDTDLFYPPLLMNVSQESGWFEATHRILWVGQETREWCFERINSLSDFFEAGNQSDDSINLLMRAYDEFNFGRKYPQLLSAPFFRYYHKTLGLLKATGSPTSMLWTNLIKCATAEVDGQYALAGIPEQQKENLLRWQHGLLTDEIQDLKPTMVVFVTGPRYDKYLEAEFPGLRRELLDDSKEQQLATLLHPELPKASFRTYHPKFLSFNMQYAPIDAMIKSYLNQ